MGDPDVNNVDEEVRKIVSGWLLPSLEEEAVCRKLQDVGVFTWEDLKYLKPESDFSDILRPIQTRKIASMIHNMFSGSSTPLSPTPSSSSRSDVSADHQTVWPASPASNSTPDDSSDSMTMSPSQNWVSSFHIPYHKFSRDLIDVCERGERPKPHLRLEMVRTLCSDIKQYTRLPGKRNAQIIANRIIAKYPKSFCDTLNSEVIGSGSSTLTTQIMDRMVNAYGRGSATKRAAEARHPTGSESKRQRLHVDTYGCINFQPDLPDDATVESLKEVKKLLKEDSLKLNEDRDHSKLKDDMRRTYALQRQLINETPSIQYLKSEWPLLFEVDFMLDHFEILTGIDLRAKLDSTLCGKKERLINFVEAKRSKTKGIGSILEKIKRSAGADSAMLVVLAVAVCLGEDPDYLVKEYEETMNTRDLEKSVNVITPHVAVVGDMSEDNSHIFLLIEKRVVAEDIKNLHEAIMMAFASYFTLNLQYEKQLASTLEFIQLCLVNLNPSNGSKCKGKNSVGKKVLGFIKGLQDFDWNV